MDLFRKTVKDKQTGQNVILSDKDVELINRIQSGKIPDPEFEDFAVSVEY
jgi:ribosome biogenesis protein ERB1